MVEHNPNHKGNVAELAIAKEAASLGLSVFAPMTEDERVDLVLGIGGRLLRVQCKWANSKDGVIVVHLASSRRGPNGYIRRNYSPTEVDAIGVYCGDLDRCFLVPIGVIAGQWAMQLRLIPPRNGQRAALHFADEYDLGAVAQQEERRRGTAEVEGSNPSSSTNRELSTALTTEEVGAHKFRNHFGYYMERAAAGAEILVRRRGKPYACLGPARSRSPRISLKREPEIR
jgi:prevent-host-death family protein